MNEPKFKVGDRVTTESGIIFGRITKVEAVYMYSVKDDEDGHEYEREEKYLKYLRLSAEDAWLEVALMVGREMYYPFDPSFIPGERETRPIRHQAYQILGGNGVKVTEEVKVRVRALIERAVKQHE